MTSSSVCCLDVCVTCQRCQRISKKIRTEFRTFSLKIRTKSGPFLKCFGAILTSNAQHFQKQNFGNTFFIQNLQLCSHGRHEETCYRRENCKTKYTLCFFSNENKKWNIWQLFYFLYKQVTIENRPLFLRRQKFWAKFNSYCINASADAQTKNVECCARIKTAHIIIILHSGVYS